MLARTVPRLGAAIPKVVAGNPVMRRLVSGNATSTSKDFGQLTVSFPSMFPSNLAARKERARQNQYFAQPSLEFFGNLPRHFCHMRKERVADVFGKLTFAAPQGPVHLGNRMVGQHYAT